MKRKENTLDGLADAIVDLGTLVAEQITALRNELKGEIAGLRDEFKGEISGLRNEVQHEISGLRSELKGEIAELRRDVRNIQVTQSDHGRRLGNVENKIDGIHSDIKELYGLVLS